MKVRNIIHKAAVLGSSATMVGATIMGAVAYDLADYPAEYIVDGNFDGKIVVGEKAATGDVLGSVDIAASLQARSVTSEDVDIPGAVGEVSLSGDAFRVETSNDLLELREPVGAVYDTLTESEIDALMGGTITTDEESTDYNQFLRFGDTAASDLQRMAVNYGENEDDELGTWLVIEDGEPFFEWEIEFTEGLESEIDTDADELPDLEDEVFNIFGTDFTFVDSEWDGVGNDLTLEFMAGDVSDTLREGETKTYTLEGVDYEVTAVFISDPASATGEEAKFAVNGEITDSLGDGDTDTLNNGLQIGVRDLLVNSREGVVEFFLGANKVEFQDNDITTNDFGGSVEIGNENIQDGEVDIIAQTVNGGSNLEITSIKYRLTADAVTKQDIYVPAEAGVREFLQEPEGMLSPTFDVRFEGMKAVETTAVDVDAQGDDSYDITLTNLRGKEFNWPLATNDDSAGDFKWGDDDDDFWFVEPAIEVANGNISVNATATQWFVGQDDYFIVSEGSNVTTSSEKDDSAIWQYTDIDTSERLLTFVSAATDEEKEVTYTTVSDTGNAIGRADNFVSEGQTYTIWVGGASLNGLEYPLIVDFDGDGNLDTSARTTFTVLGGGYVDFDAQGTQQIPTGAAGDSAVQSDANFNMTLATPANQFDDSTLGGDTLSWTVSERANNEVGLGGVTYTGPLEAGANAPWGDFDLEDGDGDNDFGMTDYGAMIEVDDPEGDNEAESIWIQYPAAQVGAQVFVTAGVTERSGGAAGSVQRDVVNPISVGMAVLDSDADGMLGSENLIIVGGPCANSVASAFLGSPANCAEGFEPGKAMISAQEFGSSVAILVAGYEAQETLGASYVLADYALYLADVEGSEVEVVATDLSDLQVSSPAPAEMMDEE